MCNCWVCKGSKALQNLKKSARFDQAEDVAALEVFDRDVELYMTDQGMDLYHATEALKEMDKPLKRIVKEHNNIMRRIKFREKERDEYRYRKETA